MAPADMVAVVLLSVLGFVLGGGTAMVWLVRRQSRVRRLQLEQEEEQEELARQLSRYTLVPYHPVQARRPSRWLAIRSRDTRAVQLALRVNDACSCTWTEGLFGAQAIFIAPPVNGWTLVFGSGLPVPDEDVDACYLWLRELSRKLGQVQFFQAEEVLQHHAWVLLESGRVQRAYAWAGATIWHQGMKTAAETALGLNCFAYGDHPGHDDWLVADHLVANVEKVSHLADRWSIDPAQIDLRAVAHLSGIAGNRTGKD